MRIGDPNKNLNDRINHMHDVFNRNQKKTDETLLEHVSVIDEKYQDVSNRIATGQAYVALSRSSPLDGLHLLKEINSKHVAVDSDNKQFYLNARPV